MRHAVRALTILCFFTASLWVYRRGLPLPSIAASSHRVGSVSARVTQNIPVRLHDLPAPPVTAKSAIVFDPTANVVIFSKNADQQLSIASTTKIMTALVSLQTYSLTEVATITDESKSLGSSAELEEGELWTIHNLLYALMLPSGNDAAVALAKHHPSGYNAFVLAMNQQAKNLGLTQTHFTNVSGLDQADHFSSVRDLAKLAKVALAQPQFAQIVQTQHITLQPENSQRSRHFNNLNQLLGQVPGVIGIKTGTTNDAGECLVTAVTRDNHLLIIVVLGSLDRFTETKTLIDWAYQTHTWTSATQLN